MADLKLDSIEGRTSGTITEVGDLKFQLATAWVNFDGIGTVAIRDSYNVSSITDNGVGNYTVNFAVSMDNANYSVGSSGGDTVPNAYYDRLLSAVAYTVTGFNAICQNQEGATDTEFGVYQVFGGKN